MTTRDTGPVLALTGGSGFLGRHVLVALENRGVSVRAVSRRELNPRFGSWIGTSLEDADDAVIARIASSHSLLHLAWGGLPDYASDRHLNHELEIQTVFLERLFRAGLRSLVISGTCLEYGMQEGELREIMPTVPEVAYARAKDHLRRRTERLCERWGVRLAWARIFYVFGPGQHRNSLWPQLQEAMSRGAARFPMSPGQQTRDFIPVREAADILVRLAIGQSNAGVVNLCSGRPVKVEDQVRHWLAERDSKMELLLGAMPYPPYEPLCFWGSRAYLDRQLSMSTHA